MIPEGPFKEADPVIRLYSVMELLKQQPGVQRTWDWSMQNR